MNQLEKTLCDTLHDLSKAYDEIEQLKALLHACDRHIIAERKWQPIETAPSGDILVYYPAVVGNRHLSNNRDAMIQVGRRNGGGFRSITHWQPLPTPPEAGE